MRSRPVEEGCCVAQHRSSVLQFYGEIAPWLSAATQNVCQMLPGYLAHSSEFRQVPTGKGVFHFKLLIVLILNLITHIVFKIEYKVKGK